MSVNTAHTSVQQPPTTRRPIKPLPTNRRRPVPTSGTAPVPETPYLCVPSNIDLLTPPLMNSCSQRPDFRKKWEKITHLNGTLYWYCQELSAVTTSDLYNNAVATELINQYAELKSKSHCPVFKEAGTYEIHLTAGAISMPSLHSYTNRTTYSISQYFLV